MPSRDQQTLPLQVPVSEAKRLDLGEDCWLELYPDFAAMEHEALLDALREELPWSQEVYRRGGRVVPAPRLTSFHGDPGCAYTYSGIAYEPEPFTQSLLALRATLLRTTAIDFNSVLANLYRDGRDSLGMHADDEPELGPSRRDIPIASLSLGAARRFVLAHRKDGRRQVYQLGGGCLLVMRGLTQQRWVHGVPKTKTQVGPRLNLTFRVITPRGRKPPQT
ncbi:MAG: alpha-ketoglutarate-dependent dioxygenase AlkB family protein [Polyangiales bacterium]